MNKIPKEINILGCRYKIIIADKPCEVDVLKRQALWGQCDYWSREIRIYKRHPEAMMQTFIHEIIHVVLGSLEKMILIKMKSLLIKWLIFYLIRLTEIIF